MDSASSVKMRSYGGKEDNGAVGNLFTLMK